jgi:tetratricopeptide (TPR) repeat protein
LVTSLPDLKHQAQNLASDQDPDTFSDLSTNFSSNLASTPDVKSLLKEGFALRNKGNYQGAIEKFDQAIAQNDTVAGSFLYRAQTFIQIRAYDAALKDFRQVLQLDPYNARAWHGQGVAKAELKLYPSAIDSFDRAIACDPNNDKIWYNQGCALLKLEQYERALESFDRAIALNNTRYHAWYSRALAQSALELIQPAIDSLSQATELKESCHYAWNYRGTLLNRLFDHQAALESFWRSLRHRVPNPNAWYGLASTYALLNNPEATAIHLHQAVLLNPSIYSLMARNDVNFDLVREHPRVRKILCE